MKTHKIAYLSALSIGACLTLGYLNREGIESKIRNYFFTNPKLSNNKEIYKGTKGYKLWMNSRFRDGLTKIISTGDYVKNKLEEINSGKEYPKDLSILIDKSGRYLKVFEGEKQIKKYRIIYGKNPDRKDKIKDGDGRTPEGQFMIVSKREHEKLGPMLLFNSEWYPNIVIHRGSIRRGSEGCIHLRTKDMNELYNLVPIGTLIKIQP